MALLVIGCGGGGGATSDAGAGADGGLPPEALRPSRPQAELDQATADFYDTWKARYLEAACASGQMRVVTAPDTEAYTVSEGHGYGMLATVIMAGHDPDAQAEFDGLYAYYAAHPSATTPGLMAWAQDAA